MTDALPEPRPSQPLPADLLRVGDAERQQAVTALGEHYAAGRLDQEEYDTRVQGAWAAKTRVDLHGLFGDLPEPVPFRPAGQQPVGSAQPGWDAGRDARDRTRRRRPGPVIPVLMAIAIFLGVSLLVHFPVVPLLFLLLWIGAGHRRGWGGGPRTYR
jgi:Domain of unknown function (DUF1707)